MNDTLTLVSRCSDPHTATFCEFAAESVDLACIRFPRGFITPDLVRPLLTVGATTLALGTCDIKEQTISFFRDSFVIKPFVPVRIVLDDHVRNVRVHYSIHCLPAPRVSLLRDIQGQWVCLRINAPTKTATDPPLFDVTPVCMSGNFPKPQVVEAKRRVQLVDSASYGSVPPAQLRGEFVFGADEVDLACIAFPDGFVTSEIVSVALYIHNTVKLEGTFNVADGTMSFLSDSFVVKPYHTMGIAVALTTRRQCVYHITTAMAPPATALRDIDGVWHVLEFDMPADGMPRSQTDKRIFQSTRVQVVPDVE
jgi:hypothetical protein